jgi:hypothetical protein
VALRPSLSRLARQGVESEAPRNSSGSRAMGRQGLSGAAYQAWLTLSSIGVFMA